MKKLTVAQICLLGIGAALNVVGANIALLLRLPIYLDSLGTILAAAVLGPVYGMFPGIASGVISGCTTDIYSFYYIPVQMVVGLMAGIFFQRIQPNGRQIWKIFLTALLISLPGTVVSSAITAVVFGGITSSGSSILVQLLHGSGLSMTASVCVVQALTDYVDRAVMVCCTIVLYRLLPASFREKTEKGRSHHGTV
ncbi:ECF transporter S component [Anaerotignum lactatifermentans]|uniref:ECF transporter S component n=1 Tax=Anaerotignum lactatifermentans TaxID=160404 RepID=A0ABS2G9X4_9FIRM|nr:ECF transporter S component [Anaerotignum lactatifermentans]MBM6828402.1 ECF transporter S component [Anaerotignum lactatifermentans]MBM6877682.1 ECF transporter S component [Anaerotignum lactatifermentans]MBM6949985.1 ECF transporter S component [Anaerotignum lactatifermentans]